MAGARINRRDALKAAIAAVVGAWLKPWRFLEPQALHTVIRYKVPMADPIRIDEIDDWIAYELEIKAPPKV